MRVKMIIPSFDSAGKNFEHWWSISGEWVELPNQRRGGESGVLRAIDDQGKTLYIKRQEKHIYRDFFHPFGQATIIREYKAYCALSKAQINIPQVVYCGVSGDKAILVTEALQDFIELDSWLTLQRQQQYLPETTDIVLTKTAQMLARLHKNRLQHGSLYGKHIFVKTVNKDGQLIVETALLDLEKVKGRLTAKEAALHDIPKIKRHSLLNQQEWQYFIKEYEQAFASKLPQLY